MIRRLALALIAIVLVVPTMGSAQRGPLPTLGVAYVSECHTGPVGCGGPDSYYANFAFFGSLQLDGGSRVGFWGLETWVENGSFGPTPISDQPIGIPFPAGACALDFCVDDDDVAVSPGGLGPDIKGSCSGQGGFLLWDLTCNFVMPGGLSGTRKIQVVFPTLDATDVPCDFFCEPTHTVTQRWGFYMRNIPGV